MAHQIGDKIVGTITAVNGKCAAGHKVGDRIEFNGHSSGGLCGFLYHDAFPYIIMLQFGGSFPKEWGDPDVITVRCTDITNAVALELRRQR
ncbi:TIGR04076 family protein [Chloroflexota bacterium]